jgi:O-succinylbenzoic acid--CoA ligase
MKMMSTFRLNGTPHNPGSLKQFCQGQLDAGELPDWKRELYSFILDWLDPSVRVLEQLTSGTTGPPRKITLFRESMIRSAENTRSYFELTPGTPVLLCLPVRYIAGKMMVVRALTGGLDLVMVEPSGRPLQGLAHRVAFAAMVPLQVYNSLAGGKGLSLVGKLLIGGGEIHPSLRERLTGLNTPELYESFGMTETYTHVALRRINGSDPDPLFTPLNGVSLGQDERGCLVVEAEGVTRGPVVTNDLVELVPERNGFRWLGRADHLISTGGIKVIPEVLEERISKRLGLECLVLSESDAQLGQRLVLLVEYPDPNPPLDQWHAALKVVLNAHEMPKKIRTVARIPRNASFKPDRSAARQML